MKKNGIITTTSKNHYFKRTYNNGISQGLYSSYAKDGGIIFESHIHQERWHGARVYFKY